MQSFSHEGFDLAFLDRQPASGSGDPVLMIHGFASSHYVNWVAPGWFKTLNDAGYRAIAFDHRGHGASTKTYDGADYTPDKMASDAAALLDHLGIERAHVMGYSMGARVSAFLALSEPGKVATLVLGGLGIGLVDGVGDWDPIAEALLADEAAAITHARGRMFRAFADQTKSDREALAACIIGSRDELSEDQVARIAQPTLIAVGTTDDIAGSPDELAALMPNATAFHIEGRDHMLSVGDRTFKKRVLEFYSEHPLSELFSSAMVELLVTYLDMTAPPSGPALASPVATATIGRENLSLAAYLDLYRAVGEPLDWDQRLRMPAAELSALLAHPSTWLNVLRVDGTAAGFCEFNGVGEPVVELVHFGLVAAFQGRRLGPYLLDSSLRAVWATRPQRVWLHTDTNDHPKALSVYQRAGFTVRERRMENFPD